MSRRLGDRALVRRVRVVAELRDGRGRQAFGATVLGEKIRRVLKQRCLASARHCGMMRVLLREGLRTDAVRRHRLCLRILTGVP